MQGIRIDGFFRLGSSRKISLQRWQSTWALNDQHQSAMQSSEGLAHQNRGDGREKVLRKEYMNLVCSRNRKDSGAGSREAGGNERWGSKCRKGEIKSCRAGHNEEFGHVFFFIGLVESCWGVGGRAVTGSLNWFQLKVSAYAATTNRGTKAAS